MKMKGAVVALVFISILAIQMSGIADVTVTDADGIYERNLSRVAIPTNAEAVTEIFNFNQNAVSVEGLFGVKIEAEPDPIKDIFVFNEQALLEDALIPTTVPTNSEPIERIFILHEGAKAYSALDYPGEMIEDDAPPVISNVTVTNVTEYSALISWDTDEFADGLLVYGTSPAVYSEEQFDELFAKNHSMALQGLVPETGYYFALKGIDRNGNVGESDEFSFVTAGL